VQVGTQVSGTIKSLAADFNATARRGQAIAVLEPSLFQSQVEQARASVSKLQADAERAAVDVRDAQAKLKRARELSAQQLISASDLDTAVTAASQAEAQVKSAEAQIIQAKAQLEQAQVNLGHTIITAPIDGIVVTRSGDAGQTVAASMQAPTLYVIAGDLTRFTVDAYPATPLPARCPRCGCNRPSIRTSSAKRTREIGLRLSVGARDRDVLTQFMVGALVLSVAGGAIGVALGFGLAMGVSALLDWSATVTPQAIALSFGVAAAVGVFFGFYPARKAARLNPIEALRYE